MRVTVLSWVVVGGMAAAGLVACADEPGTSDYGDCTSHYEQVAQAPTFRELKRELIAVTPRAATVEVLGRDGDKLQLGVLSAKPRQLLSLEAWRLDDGGWTAENWLQCID